MGSFRSHSKKAEIIIIKSFLFLLIQMQVVLASPSVSNLIEPQECFGGRGSELKKISNDLNRYKKSSLIGLSGIGKTQLSRMYAITNQERYDIIWFFDCNQNLDRQFSQLAKEINAYLYKGNKILAEDSGAKNAVINHLKHKNKILLVFDNLKINQNKMVQEFIDLEHNIHILFSSQDANKLPHIVRLQNLSYKDTKEILDKILSELPEEEKVKLSNILKGYPILISQAAYLLNDNKHLTIEDYKKNFYGKENIIDTNIKIILQNLSRPTKALLSKLIFIDNTFSQDVINRINKGNNVNEIQELVRFGLINYTNISNNKNFFEMHDTIKKSLIENTNQAHIITTIESLIISIHNSLPKRSLDRYKLFLENNTLLNSIEHLEQMAMNYNIDFFKTIVLTRHKLVFAVFSRDTLTLSKIQKLFKSVGKDHNDIKKNDILKRVSYSECIFFLGLDDFIFYGNVEDTKKKLELAKEIMATKGLCCMNDGLVA